MVSQGYLTFQLTHSAFWVGVIAAISSIPSTAFSLVGGTLVDRFPKKNILIITQAMQFFLASILGLIIISGHTNLAILVSFVFLMGLVSAVDQPARLSVVVDLVDRKDLHAATAMNMSIFNSARIVGPAIAGWLILWVGVGWSFLLNGLSFLAPIIAFNLIKFTPHIKKPHLGTWYSIKEGLHYTNSHPMIKFLLIYMAVVGIFGWSYTTILPVVAERIFHQNASGLGLLFSAAGLGTVVGAMIMSAHSRHFNPHKLIFFGGLIFSLSLLLFTFTAIFPLALMLLFFVGFGMAYQNSTIQATIQREVDDHFRGRVSSIQALMTRGMHPIGSFQVGLVAEHFGPQLAIRVGAVILLLAAIILFIKTPKFSIKK